MNKNFSDQQQELDNGDELEGEGEPEEDDAEESDNNSNF